MFIFTTECKLIAWKLWCKKVGKQTNIGNKIKILWLFQKTIKVIHRYTVREGEREAKKYLKNKEVIVIKIKIKKMIKQ